MSVCIKSLIQNVNLVIGCDIGCPYCYARNNCRRFHMTDRFEQPVFFPSKLSILARTTPHNYLLTGMSDLSGWSREVRDQVFSVMEANPQHRYIFLTKRPERCCLHTDLATAWMGVTVTRASEKQRLQALREHIHAKHYHVTFEPLHESLGQLDLTGIEWIVIGTETGRRRGKISARPEWVFEIVRQAKQQQVPVFMKEELAGIIGEEHMLQQFPPEFLYGEALDK